MNLLEAIRGPQQAGNLGQIKSMMQMVRASGNPEAAMRQMMQANPQYRKAMELVNQAGGDPRKAFYQLANQMGVNPDEIMGMIR